MSHERRVVDLLFRCEELLEQGQAIDISAICRDCPELRDEVSRRWAELRTFDGVLAPIVETRRLPEIPGYWLLEELGRGGMGVVYKALQVQLQRPVALKMILAGAHAGPADRDRFRREAEALGKLQHPNIVQVYEVGEHEGRPFFTMEFVEGGTLAQQIAGREVAGRAWPLPQAAELVETLARAMHVAHQRGLVHRDLKPGNILLAGVHAPHEADAETQTSQPGWTTAVVWPKVGTPKISDFGLAKHLQDSTGPTPSSGAILGTPSYMAPEQAAGKSKLVGPATDVYALGAILYELLTGRPPFVAASPLDVVLQVVSDPPPAPSLLRPDRAT